MNVVEPRLNDPEFKTVNGEDHLGIRYVAINISDALQPGITSITPRARYWSFFAWVIYDFIQSDYSQDSRFERTLSNFKKYLKQQECFFIFANIAVSELNPTESSTSIVGLQGIDTLIMDSRQHITMSATCRLQVNFKLLNDFQLTNDASINQRSPTSGVCILSFLSTIANPSTIY